MSEQEKNEKLETLREVQDNLLKRLDFFIEKTTDAAGIKRRLRGIVNAFNSGFIWNGR